MTTSAVATTINLLRQLRCVLNVKITTKTRVTIRTTAIPMQTTTNNSICHCGSRVFCCFCYFWRCAVVVAYVQPSLNRWHFLPLLQSLVYFTQRLWTKKEKGWWRGIDESPVVGVQPQTFNWISQQTTETTTFHNENALKGASHMYNAGWRRGVPWYLLERSPPPRDLCLNVFILVWPSAK